MIKTISNKSGFTLIELLVVIAVLAVIAAGVVAAINPGKRIRQANDAKIRNDIGQLATALEASYTTSQLYPTALSDLVTSGDLKVNPKPPGAGTTYNYSRTATCTTTSCESQVNYALEDPAVAGNVWCWRSATGAVTEAASCAP